MNNLIKTVCLLAFLCGGIAFSAYGIDYRDQLLVNQSLLYKHWNVKEKIITGYSHFSYQYEEKKGRKFIVEHNENTKPDGEAFTQKNIWFDAETGEAVYYEEFDFRDNSSISGSYTSQKVSTRLVHEGPPLEFSVELKKNTVPFEQVMLYLRKNIKQFLKTGGGEFILYLPMLARDLEKNSMPLSLSLLQMKIQVKDKVQAEGVSGKVPAVYLLLSPTSWMIRAMLPQEKTEFRFLISIKSPYYILQFEEGNTQHILTRE